MTVDFAHFYQSNRPLDGYNVLNQNMKCGILAAKELLEFLREAARVQEESFKSHSKLEKMLCSHSTLGILSPVVNVCQNFNERFIALHKLCYLKLNELVKGMAKYVEGQHKLHKKVMREEENETYDVVKNMQELILTSEKLKENVEQRKSELGKFQPNTLESNMLSFSSTGPAQSSNTSPSSIQISRLESKVSKAEEDSYVSQQKMSEMHSVFSEIIKKSAKRYHDVEIFHITNIRQFLESYSLIVDECLNQSSKVHTEFQINISEWTISSLMEKFYTSKTKELEICLPNLLTTSCDNAHDNISNAITKQTSNQNGQESFLVDSDDISDKRQHSSSPSWERGEPLSSKSDNDDNNLSNTEEQRRNRSSVSSQHVKKQDEQMTSNTLSKGKRKQSTNKRYFSSSISNLLMLQTEFHSTSTPSSDKGGGEGSSKTKRNGGQQPQPSIFDLSSSNISRSRKAHSSLSENLNDNEGDDRNSSEANIKTLGDVETFDSRDTIINNQITSPSATNVLERNSSSISSSSKVWDDWAMFEKRQSPDSSDSDDDWDDDKSFRLPLKVKIRPLNEEMDTRSIDTTNSQTSKNFSDCSGSDALDSLIQLQNAVKNIDLKGGDSKSSSERSSARNRHRVESSSNLMRSQVPMFRKAPSLANLSTSHNTVQRRSRTKFSPKTNSVTSTSNLSNNEDILQQRSATSVITRPFSAFTSTSTTTSIIHEVTSDKEHDENTDLHTRKDRWSVDKDVTPKGEMEEEDGEETFFDCVVDNEESDGGVGRSATTTTTSSMIRNTVVVSLPIAVAVQEVCHVVIVGSRGDIRGGGESLSSTVKKSSDNQIRILGDVMMSFPSSIISALQSEVDETSSALSFEICDASKLHSICPNYHVLMQDQQENRQDVSKRSFQFNMSALTQILNKQKSVSPEATFFNMDVLKYQVKTDPTVVKNDINSVCPLYVTAFWNRNESSKVTSLKIDYKCNVKSVVLKDVTFSAPLRAGSFSNLDSRPVGRYFHEVERMVWKLDKEVTDQMSSILLTFNHATNSLEVDNQQPVSVQFSCESETLSGIAVSLKNNINDKNDTACSYRISFLKKRFVSGKYVCHPSSISSI